uniref:Uncharacterized protein n=1 Tax=Romanomermis culicivorax TaxID=13658 RepID=A0A915IC78_ROMCU
MATEYIEVFFRRKVWGFLFPTATIWVAIGLENPGGMIAQWPAMVDDFWGGFP